MPWNDQANGPNGGGSKGGDGGGRRPSGGPWGGGGDGPNRPQNPWGGGDGPRRPGPGRNDNNGGDLEDMMRRWQERMRGGRGGGGGGGDIRGPGAAGVAVLGALLVAGWVASGVYTVDAGEQGVVTRFGVYHRTSPPGLHVRLPWPVEDVQVEATSVQRQLDVGFRNAAGGPERQNLVLTQDQAIVDIDYAVQWSLNDVEDYVFNIRDQEELVLAVADSAIREVVGQRTLDAVITSEQAAVADTTRDLMQRILDSYRAGVQINQFNMRAGAPQAVSEAFADVLNANQDKETKINEATRYANEIIPRARGEAAKMLQDAEAYRERVVREATGEAERFRLIQEQYRTAPRVTRERLYLETMERVLGGADKIIIDQRAGVTPYLPLDQFRNRRTGEQPTQPPAASAAPSSGNR